MTGFLKSRWSRYLTLAIVTGLLCCSAVYADTIQSGTSSGMDASPGLAPGTLDPFSGIPGAINWSDPKALQLASYWFSLISDPWNNYSLIVELFGPDAAAVLLAEETGSPLLNPQNDPGGSSGSVPGFNSGTTVPGGQVVVPEPVTAWLAGLGLAGVGLVTMLGRRRESV